MGGVKSDTRTKDFFGIPGTEYKETVIYERDSGRVLSRGYGRTSEESRTNALANLYKSKK
ncbi:MAG: hypothetical protein QW228_06875 [Candidatus Aenigmatarchaeota archaeon]